jgi:LPS-assembly protein
MKCKIVFFLLIFAVYFSLSCFGEKVIIHAQKKEFSDDIFTASGDVEVIVDDYRIYAQYVEYNKKTEMIIARGRVTMTSKESVISGEELTFNVKDRTGEMVDVYGLMQPTIRYKCNTLKQIDDETLKFRKMEFTSCSQRVPRWKITCVKGKIKKEKYISMTSALFKIKNIPVFYLPYLKYPIESDGRATGFLFPRIGNSDLRGFYLLNAFFWELKSNLDLTFNLDYYADVGLGAGGEFRYLFKKMNGFLKYYYFTYFENSVFETDSSYNYYINAEHIQHINILNTKILFKMNYPSDPNFLRQFNNDFDRVLSTNFNSSFNMTSSFSIFDLSIKASRYETYFTIDTTTDDSEEADGWSKVTEVLPAIELSIKQKKIGKLPGYFSLRSIGESIRKTGPALEGEPEYRSDFTSKRLQLIPTYTLDLLKMPWFSSTITVDSHHTIYAQSWDSEAGEDGEIVDEPLHIGYQSATAVLKGPIFFKISESKKKKTKHIIEPEIKIRFVTKLDDEDVERIVPIDKRDYPSYSFVGFTLTSRWFSKGKTSKLSPREVASFSLTQQYYLDPKQAHLNRTINGIYPEFSDLGGRFRLSPFQGFLIDFNLSYNHFIKDFTRINATVSFNKESSIIRGSISYSSYLNAYAPTDNPFNRSLFRGNLDLDIPRFPIRLITSVDYDITEKEFRAGSVMAHIDYQCLKIRAGFKIFMFQGREETQFDINITWGNMGTIADFFTSEQGKK